MMKLEPVESGTLRRSMHKNHEIEIAEDERQLGEMIFKVHYTDGTIFLELFDRFAPEPECPFIALSRAFYNMGITIGDTL
jgi:hypothetical protein